jgi:hypothetical protein
MFAAYSGRSKEITLSRTFSSAIVHPSPPSSSSREISEAEAGRPVEHSSLRGAAGPRKSATWRARHQSASVRDRRGWRSFSPPRFCFSWWGVYLGAHRVGQATNQPSPALVEAVGPPLHCTLASPKVPSYHHVMCLCLPFAVLERIRLGTVIM